MDLQLSCSCGAMKGVALNVTPDNGNRVVCCCDDCQTFAAQLKREADVLDEFGGTELYQTSQAQLRIDSGEENLRCLRLTEKGLHRLYAGCCNTPIANTMTAGVPFIGVFHNFISAEEDRDKALGPVLAQVQTQYALGAPTYSNPAKKFPLGITLRIVRKMIVWKIKGMSKPSAFFTDSGEPRVKPTIVN